MFAGLHLAPPSPPSSSSSTPSSSFSFLNEAAEASPSPFPFLNSSSTPSQPSIDLPQPPTDCARRPYASAHPSSAEPHALVQRERELGETLGGQGAAAELTKARGEPQCSCLAHTIRTQSTQPATTPLSLATQAPQPAIAVPQRPPPVTQPPQQFTRLPQPLATEACPHAPLGVLGANAADAGASFLAQPPTAAPPQPHAAAHSLRDPFELLRPDLSDGAGVLSSSRILRCAGASLHPTVPQADEHTRLPSMAPAFAPMPVDGVAVARKKKTTKARRPGWAAKDTAMGTSDAQPLAEQCQSSKPMPSGLADNLAGWASPPTSGQPAGQAAAPQLAPHDRAHQPPYRSTQLPTRERPPPAALRFNWDVQEQSAGATGLDAHGWLGNTGAGLAWVPEGLDGLRSSASTPSFDMRRRAVSSSVLSDDEGSFAAVGSRPCSSSSRNPGSSRFPGDRDLRGVLSRDPIAATGAEVTTPSRGNEAAGSVLGGLVIRSSPSVIGVPGGATSGSQVAGPIGRLGAVDGASAAPHTPIPTARAALPLELFGGGGSPEGEGGSTLGSAGSRTVHTCGADRATTAEFPPAWSVASVAPHASAPQAASAPQVVRASITSCGGPGATCPSTRGGAAVAAGSYPSGAELGAAISSLFSGSILSGLTLRAPRAAAPAQSTVVNATDATDPQVQASAPASALGASAKVPHNIGADSSYSLSGPRPLTSLTSNESSPCCDAQGRAAAHPLRDAPHGSPSVATVHERSGPERVLGVSLLAGEAGAGEAGAELSALHAAASPGGERSSPGPSSPHTCPIDAPHDTSPTPAAATSPAADMDPAPLHPETVAEGEARSAAAAVVSLRLRSLDDLRRRESAAAAAAEARANVKRLEQMEAAASAAEDYDGAAALEVDLVAARNAVTAAVAAVDRAEAEVEEGGKTLAAACEEAAAAAWRAVKEARRRRDTGLAKLRGEAAAAAALAAAEAERLRSERVRLRAEAARLRGEAADTDAAAAALEAKMEEAAVTPAAAKAEAERLRDHHAQRVDELKRLLREEEIALAKAEVALEETAADVAAARAAYAKPASRLAAKREAIAAATAAASAERKRLADRAADLLGAKSAAAAATRRAREELRQLRARHDATAQAAAAAHSEAAALRRASRARAAWVRRVAAAETAAAPLAAEAEAVDAAARRASGEALALATELSGLARSLDAKEAQLADLTEQKALAVSSRSFKEAGRLSSEIKEKAAEAEAVRSDRARRSTSLEHAKLAAVVLAAAATEAMAAAADRRREIDLRLHRCLLREKRRAEASLAAFGSAGVSTRCAREGCNDRDDTVDAEDDGDDRPVKAPALLRAQLASLIEAASLLRERLGMQEASCGDENAPLSESYTGADREASGESACSDSDEANDSDAEGEAEMLAAEAEERLREEALWEAALQDEPNEESANAFVLVDSTEEEDDGEASQQLQELSSLEAEASELRHGRDVESGSEAGSEVAAADSKPRREDIEIIEAAAGNPTPCDDASDSTSIAPASGNEIGTSKAKLDRVSAGSGVGDDDSASCAQDWSGSVGNAEGDDDALYTDGRVQAASDETDIEEAADDIRDGQRQDCVETHIHVTDEVGEKEEPGEREQVGRVLVGGAVAGGGVASTAETGAGALTSREGDARGESPIVKTVQEPASDAAIVDDEAEGAVGAAGGDSQALELGEELRRARLATISVATADLSEQIDEAVGADDFDLADKLETSRRKIEALRAALSQEAKLRVAADAAKSDKDWDRARATETERRRLQEKIDSCFDLERLREDGLQAIAVTDES